MGTYSFVGAGLPQAYDQILGPRLLEPWARLLLDAIAARAGERVLDVATGTGVVARLAAERVGASGRVVGADQSEGMLQVAREKPAAAGAAPIEYVSSPAAPLAVETGRFDLVVCQQGLQFFPDRAAALREMHRALRPQGRLGVAVWATLEECATFRALSAIAREVLPPDTARLCEVPFSFGGARALEAAVAGAGFGEVRVERRELAFALEGGIPQALSVFQAMPVGDAIAALPDEARVRMVAAAERYLSLLGEAGAVKAPMVAHLALAVR